MNKSLFDKYILGSTELSSRIVMAPLTRCRAVNNNTPNKLMAEYYGQRASAGLIVAEGTSPSPDGLGYKNIPGLFTQKHAEEWKNATDAVHQNGGKIFLQVMHTGRIGHINNLPEGANVYGPSDIPQKGEISTYDGKKHPYPTPIAMDLTKINACINEFVNCAKLSVDAGFDGIELHCAHGYLPNQFINDTSNQRSDNYGGSIENRCRFILEIIEKSIAAIGADKVGIRISPFSYADEDMDEKIIVDTYIYLTKQLDKLNIAYIHLSHMGEQFDTKLKLWKTIRALFSNTIIICGDLTKESATEYLNDGLADLVAFGRDFIANPDLVERLKNNWDLAERNNEFWYGLDHKGYTDYPFYNK
jgi:N-ethylmaleimide reductase